MLVVNGSVAFHHHDCRQHSSRGTNSATAVRPGILPRALDPADGRPTRNVRRLDDRRARARQVHTRPRVPQAQVRLLAAAVRAAAVRGGASPALDGQDAQVQRACGGRRATCDQLASASSSWRLRNSVPLTVPERVGRHAPRPRPYAGRNCRPAHPHVRLAVSTLLLSCGPITRMHLP